VPYCGLTNDLFISYAHVDNSERWVDLFHERLLNKLKQLDRGADFTIWRDRKLTGGDIFTEEIDRQLKLSGLLISILSPNGLDSSWCQKERQCFERAVGSTGGLRLRTKSRAIRVTKTPCLGDKDRLIFGTLGYEFYMRSEQTGRFSEFHPSSPEFDARVLDLAQEIYSQLQELRNRALAPPPDMSVYVASVTSDLASWRTQLVDQLVAWNCRVPPEPMSVAELSTSAIQARLDDCAVSIHLIGSKRGIIPEDEELSVDLLQLSCARALEVDRIVCHVGTPHNGWQNLPKIPVVRGKEDLITSPDNLLQLIEDRIGSLRKAGRERDSVLPTVYIVCNPSEFDDALRLKKCLESEEPCAAMLPIREVDDARVRLMDHRRTLKECEAVVIYWGAASSSSWFREQQREVIGARKKRRSRQMPVLCLTSSPHANAEADTLPGLPLQRISGLDCLHVRQYFRYLEIAGDGTQA
jgi:hypothetical protein